MKTGVYILYLSGDKGHGINSKILLTFGKKSGKNSENISEKILSPEKVSNTIPKNSQFQKKENIIFFSRIHFKNFHTKYVIESLLFDLE